MTIPIISIVSLHAEGRPWRHFVYWQNDGQCFRLEEYGTHGAAAEYAAHLYDGLGMPGFYRGVPSMD